MAGLQQFFELLRIAGMGLPQSREGRLFGDEQCLGYSHTYTLDRFEEKRKINLSFPTIFGFEGLI